MMSERDGIAWKKESDFQKEFCKFSICLLHVDVAKG